MYPTIERYEPTFEDLLDAEPEVKSYSAQIVYPGGDRREDNLLVIAGPGEVFLATELAGIFVDESQNEKIGAVWCPADVRAIVFDDEEF